jgi:HK97 family phage portal protein
LSRLLYSADMSWWAKALQAIGVVDAPKSPILLTAQVGGPVAQDYSTVASMYAISAFAWVRACVDVIATDLSGLPIVVTRGEGKTAQRVVVPELMRLLKKPTSAQRRVAWERQLIAQLLLSGNAYALRVGNKARPTSLPLLHPEGVRPIPGTFGFADGFEWTPFGGAPVGYDADLVVHFALTQWQYGPQGLLGEGLIRALANDLAADLAASKLSASQSKQGRPIAVFSPSEGTMLTNEQRKAVVDAYTKIVSEGLAAMALPAEMDVEFPAYSLRDMEFTTQRTMTRDTILAAFGVPPSRIGLPTANYATAREQMAVYWQNLKGYAALLDDGLNSIGEGWGADLTTSHDFSGIAALQESLDARLNRVSTWVMLGADPAAAASYEGFDDAPLTAGASEPTPATTQALSDWLTRGFDPAAPAVEPAEPPDAPEPMNPEDPEDIDPVEAARATLWRGWLSDVHTPTEAALAIAVKKGLAKQAEQIANRYGDMHKSVSRDLSGLLSSTLDAIFPKEVQDLLAYFAREAYKRGVQAAYKRAASAVGYSLDVARVDPVAAQLLGVMVSRCNATTRDAIAAVIADGIESGATVNDIQSKITDAAGFSPSRSLAIARTETTRSTNAGAQAAWQNVHADTGIHIQREWLSSRDASVREAHQSLDGQVIELGGVFTVPSGEYAGKKGSGPGDFDAAGMCVNCRCTTIPKVTQ